MNYRKKIIDKVGNKPIIFDCNEICVDNDLNEIHKSDFIRYYLLHKFGGVWSDMDILYIKPIHQLLHNKESRKAPAYYYYERGKSIPGHAIGFLMGVVYVY